MKEYRFELEPVLKVRENIEKQRQAELAEVRHTLRENVRSLDVLRGVKHNAQQEFLNTQLNEPPQEPALSNVIPSVPSQAQDSRTGLNGVKDLSKGLLPTAQECIQYYEYLCGIDEKIDDQSLHIEEIRKEEDVRRKSLEKASKDKLVIEEFKKQDLKDFRNKLNKFEQKIVDEMATISYNLKRQ